MLLESVRSRLEDAKTAGALALQTQADQGRWLQLQVRDRPWLRTCLRSRPNHSHPSGTNAEPPGVAGQAAGAAPRAAASAAAASSGCRSRVAVHGVLAAEGGRVHREAGGRRALWLLRGACSKASAVTPAAHAYEPSHEPSGGLQGKVNLVVLGDSLVAGVGCDGWSCRGFPSNMICRASRLGIAT